MKLFQTDSVKLKMIKEYEETLSVSHRKDSDDKKRPVCEYVGKTLKLLES